MSELVKALLVEINGNPEKLKKALNAAGFDLKVFKDKAEKGTTVVGAGADMMAGKFATASRAGASAFETIARTGHASGEAVKQLIAQGMNAALFFGPTGAFVGAIGITGLAIATMFSKTREEIAATKRAATEAFNSFVDMDANGLAARMNRNAGGDQFKSDLVDISRLGDDRQRLAALRGRGIRSLKQDTDGGIQQLIRDLPNLDGYAELTKLLDEARQALAELEAEQKVLDPMLKSRIARDVEATRVTRDLADAKKAGAEATRDEAAAAAELTAKLKSNSDEYRRLKKDVDEFGVAFDKFVRGEVAAATAKVGVEFDVMIARASALAAAGVDRETNTARADQLVELKDAAILAVLQVEDLDDELARLAAASDAGVRPTVADLARLRAAVADADGTLAQLTVGSEAHNKVLEKRNALLRAQLGIMKQMKETAPASDGDSDKSALSQKLEKLFGGGDFAAIALKIQQAADGALQLAQNLGGAGEKAVSLLRSIAQVVGNLPSLNQAIAAGATGNILAAALPIAGALSSLFGDSAEEQARREELRRNTEAIKELTERAGLLGVDVSGSDATRALRDARALTGRSIDVGTIDYANLRKVAASFGIELGKGLTGLQAFIEALEGSITKLGEFGDDLDSQKAQADAEIAIRGITDPMEILRIRMGAYAGRSPALDRATAGLDLSTAEGRAAARANIEALFATMKAGGDALGEAALGGLSGDELLAALEALAESLRELDETTAEATGSTMGVVSGYSGLSAAAGSRIEDYNRALVGYARDAQTTRLAQLGVLEALLARMSSAIPVPPLPGSYALGQGGAAVQVSGFSIEINVHVGAGTDAQGIAAAVGSALESGLGAAFTRAYLRARQASGNLSVAVA